MKVGDIVRIEFLDHAQNDTEPMLFECFGRIGSISKDAIVVYFWRYVSDVQKAKDSRDDNEDYYCIVRKAITSIKVLK